jgi:hypothetical protein
MNVLHICLLERSQSVLPLSMYNLIRKPTVRKLIALIAVIHICLCFGKPATAADMKAHGVHAGIIAFEGALLLIEFTFILSRLLTKYVWVLLSSTSVRVRLSDNSLFDPFSTARFQFKDVLLVLLYMVILADWCAIIRYRTSIEYMIPCRTALYMLTSSECRESVRLIIRTSIAAGEAFLLYFYLIVVAGCICVTLFRSTINSMQINSGFNNIVRAMTTCFVFVSTAENYSQVQYPAMQLNPLYGIFFAFLILIGVFCVLGIVISRFQSAFARQRNAMLSYKRVFTRTGMIAAFILLDSDEDSYVSVVDVQNTIRKICPNLSLDHINDVIRSVMEFPISSPNQKSSISAISRNGSVLRSSESDSIVTRKPRSNAAKHVLIDDLINIDAFIAIMDDAVSFKKKLNGHLQSNYSLNIKLRSILFESPYYLSIMRIKSVLLIGAISLYGVVSESFASIIDQFCIAFVLLSAIEVSLKIIAYGRSEFWNYAQYNIGK